jgi:hypothetical protein
MTAECLPEAIKDPDGRKSLRRQIENRQRGEHRDDNRRRGRQIPLLPRQRLRLRGTGVFREILEQFGKETLTCVPGCYGVGKGAVPFIMMQDLEGYSPLKVGGSLSADLIAVILKQLGRFHAHSFAKGDRCRDATSKRKEALLTTKDLRPGRSVSVFDHLSDLWQDHGDYKVVTHGDLWSNNILWYLMLLLLTGPRGIRLYHTSIRARLGWASTLSSFWVLEQALKRHTRVWRSCCTARVVGQDRMCQFFQRIKRDKSPRWKSKMLEIIMDCIDQSWL